MHILESFVRYMINTTKMLIIALVLICVLLWACILKPMGDRYFNSEESTRWKYDSSSNIY